METTKRGFVKRKITIEFWYIPSLIIFLGLFYIGLKSVKDKKNDEKIHNDSVIVIIDSIPMQDKKILQRLLPILKKREGFSDTIYTCRGKRYIGYGHLVKQKEHFSVIISENFADSLLKKDIEKSYWEVQRIQRKELQKKIYNVFISGDINCK